ncbi:MAG: UMP kinase [Candidatus Levybacteria bacterium]|nr:UMP kinase [Candidatus Levybacteria bacterium]
MAYSDKIVMSIGGSLIVPEEGIDTKFLASLNRFVRENLAENKKRQFFLVAGGGRITRHYQMAARKVIGHELTHDDLDWLGIHSTRLNAQLLRTIFRDIAHPFILKHYDIIRKPTEPVVIASGWKPGSSTDFDAVLVCEDYGVRSIINLSNVETVFDKDPNKYKDAKPIHKITWSDFRKIVGDKWTPGLNAPFDPTASKKAHRLNIKVAVLSGHNFKNLQDYIDNKDFIGTVIE